MLRDHFTMSNGRLQRKDNTLNFIKEGDDKKQSLPVEKVRSIHIFGEVDLNTRLLNFLSQKDVILHIYNYYGFYSGSYYPREKSVSGVTIINQSVHYVDRLKRVYIAKQFILSAVHHMLRNLRRYKEETKEEVMLISQQASKIMLQDHVNALMGVEGQIRKIYYQGLRKALKNDFGFVKREKRPPKDPLNALISFGNQLTYTSVLSEMYKTVLNPTISYLHEPSTKRFSLSLDIAEIFKPLLVDPIILSLINRGQIKERHFEFFEEEIVFLNEEGRKVFIRAWEDRLAKTIKHRKLKRQVSYRYLIRLECYKLIKHVIDDEQYVSLKAWW